MIYPNNYENIYSCLPIEQYKMSSDSTGKKELKECGCIIITRIEASEHDRPFTYGTTHKIVHEYQCKDHYKK